MVLSYLSSSTCEKIINLMAKKIKVVIINKAKNRKYYSLAVDSTHNITHSNQFAFILRYASNKDVPTKQFLEFISKVWHKSLEIT